MMFKVFCMIPNQHPIFVAEYYDKEYAQVVVDAGNKLYDDGREFWLDETEEEIDEIDEYGYWKRTDVDDYKFIPYETRY